MLRVIAQPLSTIASNATYSPSVHRPAPPCIPSPPVPRSFFLLFALFIEFVLLLNCLVWIGHASLTFPRRCLAALISGREPFFEQTIECRERAAPLSGIPESIEAPVDTPRA